MKIEHVTRIRFAARRTTQQKRHLAIGHSLLGQIIINDQGVFAIVTEPFANCAACKRRKILQRCRLGGGRRDDDRIFKGAALCEGFNNLRNGGTLLADGDIDAKQLLAIVFGRIIDLLLVQDRIDTDRGLAGLAVTNNKFTLATANRDHPVNRLNTGHHRLMHRLTRQNARRFHVNTFTSGDIGQRALPVNRLTKRVNHAAKQALANRRGHNLGETLNIVALFNAAVIAKDNDTDIVGFEVQRHAFDAAIKFDHFTSFDIVETVNAGDPVSDGENLTDIGDLRLCAEILDLGLQDVGNFRSSDIHER